MRQLKVLHIGISSESGVFGGVERYMTDYYSHMDHSKFVFDFLFCRENSLTAVLENEYMKSSSVKALHILRDKNNSLSDFYRLYKLVLAELKNTHYDIIHVDTSFTPVQIACLWAAKKNGNQVRIAHSHSSGRLLSGNVINKTFKRIFYKFSKSVVRFLATDYFACSIQAGEALFGKKGVRSKRFIIIKNAIQADKYRFDDEKRKKVRESNNVQDSSVVFGSVGRIDPVKNIEFIIDVFREFYKKNKNSMLWIIGDGPQKNEIVETVNCYGLEKEVIFFGQRSDIADLMQGMDVFLFPSQHEGLGISAIEAQAAGLPVYASITIPRETTVTDLIKFYPISDGAEKWAKEIHEDIVKYERQDTCRELIRAGYDIGIEAKKLEDIYIQRVKG